MTVSKQAASQFWILWGALVVSQPLFVLVGYMLRRDPNYVPQGGYEVLLLPLSVVAMLLAGAALFGVERILPLTKDAKLQQAFVTRMIIKLALCESIGLFGFVLFFLGAPWEVFLIFVGLAVLLMLSQAPTEGRVQEFVRDLAQKN